MKKSSMHNHAYLLFSLDFSCHEFLEDFFPYLIGPLGGNSIGFFDRLKLGDPAQSIVSGPPNSLMLGMTWAIAQLWAV